MLHFQNLRYCTQHHSLVFFFVFVFVVVFFFLVAVPRSFHLLNEYLAYYKLVGWSDD
jgi:hypothetical protein